MPTRVSPGHYRCASHETTDEKKSTSTETIYGVIRGDIANDAEYGAIGNQFGFTNSKWYAYKRTKTSITPQLRFSPTAPEHAHEKHFDEIRFAQQAFDTKAAAVDHVETELISYRHQ